MLAHLHFQICHKATANKSLLAPNLKRRYGLRIMSRVGRIACFISLTFLFIIMVVYQDTAFTMNTISEFSKAKFSERWAVALPLYGADGNDSSEPSNIPDRLLDGLLSQNFDEKSCLSRFQSDSYRKPSPFKPSPYLTSKLQSYEERHKRCAPYTNSYNRSIELLNSGHVHIDDDECKYVIWVASHGLGNRLLSIAGSFLYALLTDRVLLINQDYDTEDLFCEPFPDSSWTLPPEFPFKNELGGFNFRNPQTYGNFLRNYKINASTESPPYLYIYLNHDRTRLDKLFYCDEHQPFLRKVPWLMFKSNLYFIPSMFLMDSFEEELTKLFPDKETVFHHLGRYLFHPSNKVWEIITKYYQKNLAKAEEKIGMQIRVFNRQYNPSQVLQPVMDQILDCVQKEKLLPEVDMSKNASAELPETTRISKAVLITSLYRDFYENMTHIYREHKTRNGEMVEVYQPSHERIQKFGNKMHNVQAWAEIYLLSYSDVLVTSAHSTFGYVAQSLGGKKPYILKDGACGRALSMEPCNLTPPVLDCKKKTNKVDVGSNIAPYVRHCEDRIQGIKLFNT